MASDLCKVILVSPSVQNVERTAFKSILRHITDHAYECSLSVLQVQLALRRQLEVVSLCPIHLPLPQHSLVCEGRKSAN